MCICKCNHNILGFLTSKGFKKCVIGKRKMITTINGYKIIKTELLSGMTFYKKPKSKKKRILKKWKKSGRNIKTRKTSVAMCNTTKTVYMSEESFYKLKRANEDRDSRGLGDSKIYGEDVNLPDLFTPVLNQKGNLWAFGNLVLDKFNENLIIFNENKIIFERE